jgi:hypothetical protein
LLSSGLPSLSFSRDRAFNGTAAWRDEAWRDAVPVAALHKVKPDAQIAVPNGHFATDHGNVPTLNSALYEGTPEHV